MFKKLRGKLILIGLLTAIWWWIRRPQPGEASKISVGEIPVKTVEIEIPAEAQPPAPAVTIGPVVAKARKVSRAKKAAAPKADDLTTISGIGPKISAILQEAGITRYAQLAEADAAHLWQILEKAGIRLAKPETWIEQAKALHKE